MKNIEPCKVCGSTEANVIDGYYYCVECGTQDVNVRETVVEEMELADGTISYKQRKKIYKAAEEGSNLSGEWYKWHAYNFILVGLADEMIAIGAKPSFKTKLLWLWTEYMKKYQNKKELGLNTEDEEKENIEDDSDKEEENDIDDKEIFKCRRKRNSSQRKNLRIIDLSQIKRAVLFGLIYVALHLDGNNIHVTDLLRFMKQGKFSILNCEKFIPKEINIHKIPQFARFFRSRICVRIVETYIISIFKCFKILPPIPDLKELVHRYAKELCLPKDFKNLVFSLMHLLPCDHLKLDYKIMTVLVHIPPYECFVMAYFLVAFKMLFGLDDDYELKLSDAVNKINDENCYLKSYNLGNDSEPTDRLFSFREWCHFIQLRKMVICKNYLHMAEHYEMPIDHYVYMEHCLARKARKPNLSDEITMTLLGRIPQEAVVAVIPISEFKASLTPLSSASDVVLQYFNDPDLKLLFSEDFTQYSLKYATEKLYLNDDEENPRNVVTGVSLENKVINKKIIGTLETKKLDSVLVYVRNCENKNWLKTNQPSVDHVTKVESDKESDHGYDSNVENASTVEISINDTASAVDSTDTPVKEDKPETTTNSSVVEENSSGVEASNRNSTNVTNNTEVNESKNEFDDNDSKSITVAELSSYDDTSVGTETPIQEELKRELEKIEEEDFDKNIFDDDFKDLVEVKSELEDRDQFEFDNQDVRGDVSGNNVDDQNNFPSTSADHHDARSETSVDESYRFLNEATFDREKTIRELILATCKKYRIRIPVEYRTKEPKKRKSQFIQDGAGESGSKKRKLDDGTPKRSKAKKGQAKDEVNNLLASYFENLQHDVIFQVSEHVKSVVNNISRTHEEMNDTRRQAEVADYDNSQRTNVTDSIEHQENTQRTELNRDVTNENNEIDGSVLDQSSVQLIEGDQIPTDPRFDENEYDPKQLYVRIEGENEIEDVFDIADDPDIAAILDKKLDEVEKGEMPNYCHKEINYDSDDDLPLSAFQKEKESLLETDRRELPPFVLNHGHIGEYNYWTRQYYSDKIRKATELHGNFYVELDKHFPKNFTFVLKECADVIGYSPFRLYKVLMDLERRLLCHATLN